MKNYLAGVVIVIASVFVPAFTHAATVSELQTRINDVSNIIAQLEVLLAETNSNTSIVEPIHVSCSDDLKIYFQNAGINICNI
jgi:hypothetical protein